MLKKIAGAGLNIGVLVVSVLVFVIAFILMSTMNEAQKPATAQVLVALNPLDIGDVIQKEDLGKRTVYVDDNTRLYFPASQAADVIGGLVVLPIPQGHPIIQTSVLAGANVDSRLAAVLQQFPESERAGLSLFPLPLDLQNVTAPALSSFVPGDLIGITVVLEIRPQKWEATPTPGPGVLITGQYATPQPVFYPTPTPYESDDTLQKAIDRSYPPLSKELFPQGIRVVAVQGLPKTTTKTSTTSSTTSQVLVQSSDRPMLILLVPQAERERLALAIEQGSQVFVSVLSAGSEGPTTGFTYWDLEEWFKQERSQLFAPSTSAATPLPTHTPTVTPQPTPTLGTQP